MSYIGKKNGNPNTDFLEAGGELENHDLINVDSSSNLLVGKTSSSTTTAGFEARSNGQTVATIDGGTALIANRKTSDGDVIKVMKDGTVVGTIGVVNNNNPFIANDADNSGLQFGTNQIIPHYDSLQRDNAVDLGSSSVRFKDFYLSGGVYVGGTGSANYLDDYEEGTWTPAPSVGAASTTNGNYTKIGNTVHVWGYVAGFTNTTNNEPQTITGLPFTPSASRACGSAMWDYVDADSRYGTVYIADTSAVYFYDASRNSGFDNIRCIDMDGSGTSVWFSATYYTNS